MAANVSVRYLTWGRLITCTKPLLPKSGDRVSDDLRMAVLKNVAELVQNNLLLWKYICLRYPNLHARWKLQHTIMKQMRGKQGASKGPKPLETIETRFISSTIPKNFLFQHWIRRIPRTRLVDSTSVSKSRPSENSSLEFVPFTRVELREGCEKLIMGLLTTLMK